MTTKITVISDDDLAKLRAKYGAGLRRYDDPETGDLFFFSSAPRPAWVEFMRTRRGEPQGACEALAKASQVWPFDSEGRPESVKLDDYFEECPAAAAIMAAYIADASGEAIPVVELTERDGRFPALLAQHRKIRIVVDPATGTAFAFRKARRSEFAVYARAAGDAQAASEALARDCLVAPEKREGFPDVEALTAFLERSPAVAEKVARAIVSISGAAGQMAPVGN